MKLPSGSKNAERAGSMVASSISSLPTYVLQVLGLGADTPVKAVTDEVAAGVPGASVLRADRSALLKFRKHSDVRHSPASPSMYLGLNQLTLMTLFVFVRFFCNRWCRA